MRLKQIIREYFTFSRTEKRGLWLLGVGLLLSVAVPPVIRTVISTEPSSLEIQTVPSGASETGKTDTVETFERQPFNPNTVSEEALKAMGVSDFVASNWMKYREAGGKFFYRDDVLALYGMDKEMYLSLRKYIEIPRPSWEDYGDKKKEFSITEPIDINAASAEELRQLPGIGPIYSERIVKYRNLIKGFDSVQQLSQVYGLEEETLSAIKEWLIAGPKPEVEEREFYQVNKERSSPTIIVDLNTADSAALVSLRGIGPVFTRRILAYRNALGGFHAKEQLLEVYGFPPETYESLKERLVVSGNPTRKLNINKASSKALSEHPYISTALANFIVSYRMNHNGFTSLDELKESFLVDEALFTKLSNYLSL